MKATRPAGDDLLDVARVLLLLQGSLLLTTTVEAVVWGAAFGAGGAPAVLSAAAAAALLVARARLRPDRRWTRRIIHAVEALLIVTLVIDAALAFVVIRGMPPVVAVVTRLVVPLAVITLLRRTKPIFAATAEPAIAWDGA